MTDETNNLTRAGVTGKVPLVHRPSRRSGKKLKMTTAKKHHASHLMKRGAISQKAATTQGIAK